MRRDSLPAMIVAVAALVVALTGSAVAAKTWIITSESQIKPSVLKELQGAEGPEGKRGPAGAPGEDGSARGYGLVIDGVFQGSNQKNVARFHAMLRHKDCWTFAGVSPRNTVIIATSYDPATSVEAVDGSPDCKDPASEFEIQYGGKGESYAVMVP